MFLYSVQHELLVVVSSISVSFTVSHRKADGNIGQFLGCLRKEENEVYRGKKMSASQIVEVYRDESVCLDIIVTATHKNLIIHP